MPKLPVFRLVRHATLDVVAHAGPLVRLAALWLLLPALLAVPASAGLLLIGDLVASIGVTAVAVAWHRRLLLNEPEPRWAAPANARVARYLLLTVATVLVIVVPVAVTLQLTTGGLAAGPSLAGSILVLAAAVAGFYAAMRLQLVFPAVATDDAAGSLAAAWAASAGNGWRLGLGFTILTLPVTAAGLALAEGLDRLGGLTGSVIVGLAATLMPLVAAIVQAALLAAFLSLAMLFLRRPQPASAQGER